MRNSIILMIICILIVSVSAPIVVKATEEHDDEEQALRSIIPPTRDMSQISLDMNIEDINDASFVGERENDNFADDGALKIIGDVNGDGIDDILMGAYKNSEAHRNAGKAYLVFGRSEMDWGFDINVTNCDGSWLGLDQNDYLGGVVASAGDVNGDGYGDFLISGSGISKIYLFFGKSSGWNRNMDPGTTASASFVGGSNWCSCSGVGDVNRDGYDDIAFGIPLQGGGGVYLFFGKPSGWAKDVDFEQADVKFIAEGTEGRCGGDIQPAGDVNGDDVDDFLIIDSVFPDMTYQKGKIYVIFGRESNWPSDYYLNSADASYVGENDHDYLGSSFGDCLKGRGDFNGDGYDDIVVGSWSNGEAGNQAGKVYVIQGKSSGWPKDVSIGKADVSFRGKVGTSQDRLGPCSFIEDLNSDGCDDLALGGYYNGDRGNHFGIVYFVLGAASGYGKNMSITDVAIGSVRGEMEFQNLGFSLSSEGDITGDGSKDLLIGCMGPSQGKLKAYFLTGFGYSEPVQVFSLKAYSDANYNEIIEKMDIFDTVYFELVGQDSNASHKDAAFLNITYSKSISMNAGLALRETEINSGIYRGKYRIPLIVDYLETLKGSSRKDPSKYVSLLIDYPFRPSSVSSLSVLETPSSSLTMQYVDLDQGAYIKAIGIDSNPIKVDKAFVNLTSDKNSSFRQLVILTETGQNTGVYVGMYTVPPWMEYFENITVRSVETSTVWTKFMVHTPLQLRTDSVLTLAKEDEEYNASFWNFGYETAIWTVTESAEWLEWDLSTKELHGIPDNSEVGAWAVTVRITDTRGHNDTLDFDIEVENRPPVIITNDVLTANEDENYYVDYNSDDDSQGEVSWYLSTNAPFLSIDKTTGVLSGRPINEDVGEYYVTIQTSDGNKGMGSHDFDLTVLNVNDRPIITTTDVKTIMQNDPFIRDYEVLDPDVGDSQSWSLMTDADWLMMNGTTGVLNGTPMAQDVGVFTVNITVSDLDGLKDYREFDLEVMDEPDPPFWDDVPTDITLIHGDRFYFDVNATDYDPDNIVEYSIRSKPESNISINPDTGVIDWVVDINCLTITSNKLEVTLKASDGSLFSTHVFYITILPTEPPVCTLISPEKGSKISMSNSVLRWNGTDPENDALTYNVYLGESESIVTSLREEVLLVEDIIELEYALTVIEPGKTYYWTVIPNDGCSAGMCVNGPFSFKVNNKPMITEIDRLSATSGKGFSVKISCNDPDSEDSATFSFVQSPKGMDIKSDTGYITWTPGSDQTGENRVTVKVTDGYDTAEMTFFVDVEKGEGLDIGLTIGLAVGTLLLIIIIVLIYLFVVRKRSEGKEMLEGSESDEIALEMEKHQKEKEWEESHYREGGSNVISDVPLSATEAHTHDKERRGKPKSYEELYGARMSEE